MGKEIEVLVLLQPELNVSLNLMNQFFQILTNKLETIKKSSKKKSTVLMDSYTFYSFLAVKNSIIQIAPTCKMVIYLVTSPKIWPINSQEN